MARAIEGLAGDWRWLDQRIEELSNEIEELARRDPACVRLMSVPGIGPIISSAMVAAIGTRRRVFQGARLRRLARARAQADLHWRSHHSRFQHIEAWQSLSARPIRCKQPGSTLVKVSPNKWARPTGSSPGSEPHKKRLHHNVLAHRACQQARAYRLEACWLVVEASRRTSSKRPNHWQIVELFYPPKSQDETRWSFGLPGACEHSSTKWPHLRPVC